MSAMTLRVPRQSGAVPAAEEQGEQAGGRCEQRQAVGQFAGGEVGEVGDAVAVPLHLATRAAYGGSESDRSIDAPEPASQGAVNSSRAPRSGPGRSGSWVAA